MSRAPLLLAVAMSVAAPVTAQEVGPIVSEGVIDAPVDSVWAVWASSEGLRSWLAPHVDIDLRIGGLIRTNYDPRGSLGDAQTIENTILSFEPGRMLSIKVSKAPANFPFPNAVRNMWTVMYFDPEGERQTRVRVIALGFGKDAESQRMRAFFERGNAVTVQQMQRRFAATR